MPVVIVAGFGAVILALFAWQVLASWDYTIGPAMRALADAIDSVSLHIPHITTLHIPYLAGWIRAAEKSARHAIGVAAYWVTQPLVLAFKAAEHAVIYPVRETRLLAGDVLHALRALRQGVIPAMIAAKVAWIPRHLVSLEHQIQAIPHTVTRIATHTVTRVVPHYSTVIVKKAVAVPVPRLGRLERETAALSDRLAKLVRRVPATIAAGAVAAALAGLGLTWTRCSRAKKWGKATCGMNDDLLDSLIADTLLIVGTISLVEFAEGLQAGMGEFAPQVRHFWGVK